MGSLLQIRDVPDESRRELKARAAQQGRSLNAYLLELIEREVSRPSVAEVLARARLRSGRTGGSVVEAVSIAREERDSELLRRLP